VRLDEEDGMSTGKLQFILTSAVSALAIVGVLGANPAQGADQLLDSIVTSGTLRAQAVVQTPTLKTIDYTDTTQLQGTHNIVACQGTGTRGLYCLDIDLTVPASPVTVVLRWQNPDKDPIPSTAITCAKFGLVACTGATVDLGGTLWVAGQTPGGTYSLFKAFEKGTGACPVGTTDANPYLYCIRQFASGQARIYDLTMVDAQASGGFPYGAGVIALRDPAPGAAVFFADALPLVAPRVLNDKWQALSNGEVLQGVALLQQPTSGATRNFVLVTGSLGKVLVSEVLTSGNPKSFDTGLNLATLTGCAPGSGPYDAKASYRTRRSFFTAGTCIAGYDPTFVSGGNSTPVTFPAAKQSFVLASTFPLTSGVTVSPGIELDFRRDGCTTPAGCTLVADGGDLNSFDAATFARIQLEGTPSGWVYYLVKNLRDCRYVARPLPSFCAGTLVNADGSLDDGSGDPTKQSLDFKPLLPPEILQAFPPGYLPQMLLGPDYRARPQVRTDLPPNSYAFDAIFGIPEAGLTYRDTFDVTFDIADLLGPTGTKLGCGGLQYASGSTTAPAWDPIVNISEFVPTVGGYGVVNPGQPNVSIGTPNFVSMLLNNGCTNPTSGSGIRGSAFLYGLERAPKGKNNAGNWIWPDSTFALLMRSLARDYNDNLYTYTCQNLDNASDGNPPVSPAQCAQLQFDWSNVYKQLIGCVNATDKPKTSGGDQNCKSFETKFEAYKVEVGQTTQFGADPFNRFGEFTGRTYVMSYFYYEQFKKSIRDKGFVDPNF
jgi:hypothetical protein